MRQILELDRSSSWSIEIQSFIKDIVAEEARIEQKWSKISEIDRRCRMDEIMSDYDLKRLKEKELNNLLSNYDVVCYHYTRLTDQDVQSVKTNGLLTLNEDEHKHRLIMLAKEQHFSNEVIKYIETFNYNTLNGNGGGGIRVGNLHFVYSILTDNFGCDTFLEIYGGEITYHILFNYKKEQSLLNKISKPFVIKFKIPYEEILCNGIIKNMIEIYKVKGKVTSNNCGEDSIRRNVECERILEIMSADNLYSSRHSVMF